MGMMCNTQKFWKKNEETDLKAIKHWMHFNDCLFDIKNSQKIINHEIYIFDRAVSYDSWLYTEH